MKKMITELDYLRTAYKLAMDRIEDLEEENRKLKESLDIATKCSSKEEDGIIRLSKENENLTKCNLNLQEHIDKVEEENRKLKLHIEAKDKAYVSLLKDFDEMRADMKELKTDYDRLKRAFNDVLYDK